MESLLPFLQGTCTPYNMPVYPGAQRKIAESLSNRNEATRLAFRKQVFATEPYRFDIWCSDPTYAPETSSSKSIGRRPPRHVHNPRELVLFTRCSDQRIGARLICYRKARPGSQLHPPDTKASQIAKVHLSNGILQDEGRIRDGEHIIGADSTLHIRRSFHQAVSLQNHSALLQAAPTQIELLTRRAYKPRLSLTAISISCSDPR